MPNKKEIEELANHQASTCISIFIPTHRAGVAVNEKKDVIQLKNQLQEVSHTLQKEREMSPEATQAILEPAYALLDNDEFWYEQQDGLALFLADSFFTFYSVPYAFQPLNVIYSNFYVKELTPLLQQDKSVYVLSVSLNDIKLHKVTTSEAKEVALPDDTPTSYEEGMKYTETEASLQHHTGADGRGSGTMYHGQGNGKDERDVLIREEFMRKVADGVFQVLKSEQTPLVLFGTERTQAAFRQANHYEYLHEDSIVGNPDEVKPHEIREKAQSILEKQQQAQLKTQKQQYHEHIGTGKASYQLEELVRAAVNGRVETLFVPRSKQVWGAFDPKNQQIDIHTTQKVDSECLLNKATVHTLDNGGTVFTVNEAEIPEEKAEAAAVFRY